jgi:Skp family chaperone for outer membrane proteins
LNQELSKQQSVLSQEAFDEKFRDFSNKVSEVQREFQVKKNSIDQADLDAISKIEEVVNAIVIEVAKSKGLTLVIPSASTMFYKTELDITDQVLKSLDQRLKKIDIKYELPPATPKGAKK